MEGQEGPPEIPVLEDHSPPSSVQEGLLTAAVPPPRLSLQLLAPERDAAAPAAPAASAESSPSRRWSFDRASAPSSLLSDWELLSHGPHSHCGSSPRSVSPSDAAYESDDYDEAVTARAASALAAEAVAGACRRCEAEDKMASAASQLAGQAQAPAQAAEGGEMAISVGEERQADSEKHEDLVPFGSLVMPAQGPLAAAVAAGEEEENAPVGLVGGGALVGGRLVPSGSLAGSGASSPRSSYGRASSRASRHDLYSLSQDGSGELFSDHDSFIDDMMAQAEPYMIHVHHDHSTHSTPGSEHAADLAPGSAGGKLPPSSTLHLLAAAPAATLAAAARAAYCAASSELRQLADSFGAYLARIVPAGADVAGDVAQRVARGMAEIMGCLRVRLSPLLPLGLTPLTEQAAAVGARVQVAVHHARKQLGFSAGRIPWAKVALALGGLCGVMAIGLLRSRADNARLAALLSRREADFSSLLMRIHDLQRNITAYQSNAPIIRHVSMAAAVTSGSAAYWPAVVAV